MENLEPLASITRLSKRVVRVLGQNPSKFTLQGTNTYIVGRQNPYVLIDTGEGRSEYIPVLEEALKNTAGSSNSDEPDVSDIIISHRHYDHVGGLPSVLALLRRMWDERNGALPFKPPRLHKFPYKSDTPDARLDAVLESLIPNTYTPDPSGRPIHDLCNMQILPLTSRDDAETESLQVLHTPGHTTDSICLYIPGDRALFTADTVLGQGTAVFEDLAAYIASLRKMLDFGKAGSEEEVIGKYTLLYPGHGPVVSDGPSLIRTYIKHRQEREDQIVEVLSRAPPEGGTGFWTTWSIVTVIYAAYPENLWLAATQSVDLHLRKLEGEGRVKKMDGEGKDTEWELVT